MATKKKTGAAREAARRAQLRETTPAKKPAQVHSEVWAVMQSEGVSETRAHEILMGRPRPPRPKPASVSGTSRRDRLPADELAARRLRARVKSVALLRQRLEAEVVIRDRYVARLRDLGWSWERIAAEAGVSRQALTKRVRNG